MDELSWPKTLVLCLVIIVMTLLAVFLTGCAGQGLKMEVVTPDKEISLKTDYQIENGFKMTRNTETGEYEIELGSATTKDAEMGVIIEMLRMMQTLWMQSLGTPVPPDTN
jgi:hypothetical protein